jgi:hypothetical protein
MVSLGLLAIAVHHLLQHLQEIAVHIWRVTLDGFSLTQWWAWGKSEAEAMKRAHDMVSDAFYVPGFIVTEDHIPPVACGVTRR